MKIVVTGATGNLGTSTMEALLNDRRVSEVVGIARRQPRSDGQGCLFTAADVTRDNLDRIFQGASTVIHLAWQLQPAREQARLDRVNIGGTRRVLEAVSRVQVPSLVVASSVGAYSPGPKDRTVDEAWPTEGISSSLYSRQKAQVERILDRFETQHPSTRVVRMRPALVFKAGAASEIRRLFLGRWVPKFLLRPGSVPFVPDTDRLRFQCVHSLDVGLAFALAALSDVRGAFNIAAAPVLDAETLASTLGARRLRVSENILRQVVGAAWRMHLAPIDGGWVDLALQAPLMNTEKARHELGFEPEHSSTEALIELMSGMHDGVGMNTPPLQPRERTRREGIENVEQRMEG